MQFVLTRIEASLAGAEKHYILLVGPRGCGKTHFLALTYHRITSSQRHAILRHKLHIAYLNEEEWGVASYLDLILRVIESLRPGTLAPDAESRLRRITQVHHTDPALSIDLAESLLTDLVADGSLLLLCENLSDLFRGIGTEGQKRFRAFIQRRPYWIILATTPSVFAAIQLQRSPFYGFFQIRHLRPLDFDTALHLLERKAIHEGKHDLAQTLTTAMGRARVRAIHHLAGGNHRIYVVMFDFLDKESLDELVTPFLRMIDDLTPYYQDRLRQLAPAQRKLVEFLCRRASPVTVTEAAEPCLMTNQTAAKQLLELTKMGFVGRSEMGRNTYYEVAEPLMRLCIEVKDNRASYLRLFVNFLRHWYSSREIETRFVTFSVRPHAPPSFDQVHLEAALREFSVDRSEPFLDALETEARRCLESDDYVGLVPCARKLVADRGCERDFVVYARALIQTERRDEALEVLQSAAARFPSSVRPRRELGRLLYQMGRLEDCLAITDEIIQLAPDDVPARCARGNVLGRLGRDKDVLLNEEELLKRDPKHAHSFLQKARALSNLGDFEGAMREVGAYREVRPKDQEGVLVHAQILLRADRPEEALRAMREIKSGKAGDGAAAAMRGNALMELGRYQEALKYLRAALSHMPDSVGVRCNICSCLVAAGKYRDAITACDELIAIDPAHWHGYLDKARSLMAFGRLGEAASAARLAVEHIGADVDGLASVCWMLAAAKDFHNALDTAERALLREPRSLKIWRLYPRLALRVGRPQLVKQAEGASALRDMGHEVFLGSLGAEVAVEGYRSDAIESGVRWALQQGSGAELIARTVADIILGIVNHREISALSIALQEMRHLAEDLHLPDLVSMSAMWLLKEYVDQLGEDRWGNAIRIMRDAVEGAPASLFPLDMLSVAHEFLRSGNPKFLLKLPSEARNVLLESFRDSGIDVDIQSRRRRKNRR